VKTRPVRIALNVFVRVNSAEPLSLSDMLMSTAIAHWKTKDARKVIPALVQEIRQKGFFIDKDFVLKACLYLYSSDIRYRVSNFTAARVKPFEDNWDAIRASISIPGIFRAFLWNGKYLIDGCVSEPLPVRILNRYGAKKIIAVNVLPSPDAHFSRMEIAAKKLRKTNELIQTKNVITRLFYEHRKKILTKQSANIFNVLMRTIQFMGYGIAEAAAEQADIVLNPVVIDAHWAEFFSHEKFIRRGIEETRKRIPEIKELLRE